MKIMVVFLLLILFSFTSCSEMEPQNQRSRTVHFSTHQRASTLRSTQANTAITLSEAKTALVILVPENTKFSSQYLSLSNAYDQSLIDLQNNEVTLNVPLETQLRVFVYFFKEELSLESLTSSSQSTNSFGESEVFSINSETKEHTLSIGFWSLSYGDLSFSVSSDLSLVQGGGGKITLTDLSGAAIQKTDFTVDNASGYNKDYPEMLYNTYSYQVDIDGYDIATGTFSVNSPAQTVSVSVQPSLVDINWVSFENTTMTLVSGANQATVSGTLLLTVPKDKEGTFSQFVASMQLKRVGGESIPVDIASTLPAPTVGSNGTLEYRFSFTKDYDLVNGVNELLFLVSVGEKTQSFEAGSITGDQSRNSSALNVSLSWGTTGQDLDLHSFYFPSWAYGADYTAGTFNPGIRYQVNNQNITYNGVEIHDKTSKDALGPESHTWGTDVQGNTKKVADGSYLFYVHDNSGIDVDNATLVLKGPGITGNITLGPFSFKNGAAQALNPQAFFFVQVQGNTIKQVTEIARGTNINAGSFTTRLGANLTSAAQLSTHIGTLDVIQL